MFDICQSDVNTEEIDFSFKDKCVMMSRCEESKNHHTSELNVHATRLSPEDRQTKKHSQKSPSGAVCLVPQLSESSVKLPRQHPDGSDIREYIVKRHMARKESCSETIFLDADKLYLPAMGDSLSKPKSISFTFSDGCELSKLKINPVLKEPQCLERAVNQNRSPVFKDFPYGNAVGISFSVKEQEQKISNKPQTLVLGSEKLTDTASETEMDGKCSAGESGDCGDTKSTSNIKSFAASPLTEFLMKNVKGKESATADSNLCRSRKQMPPKITFKALTAVHPHKLSACGDGQTLSQKSQMHVLSSFPRRRDVCGELSKLQEMESSNSVPSEKILEITGSNGQGIFSCLSDHILQVNDCMAKEISTVNLCDHSPLLHDVDSSSESIGMPVDGSLVAEGTEEKSFVGRKIFLSTRGSDGMQNATRSLTSQKTRVHTDKTDKYPTDRHNKENELPSGCDDQVSDGLTKACLVQRGIKPQLNLAELSSDAPKDRACQAGGTHKCSSGSEYSGMTLADLEELRRNGFMHAIPSPRKKHRTTSTTPKEKSCSEYASGMVPSEEQLEEEARAAVTRLHTILNGEKQHKQMNGLLSPVVLTHYPPPKEPSRITWNQLVTVVPASTHTPNVFPSCPRPILQKRAADSPFPFSDDPPSPIIVTRKRQLKSDSSYLR